MSTVSAKNNSHTYATVADAVLYVVGGYGPKGGETSEIIERVLSVKRTSTANVRNELSKLTKRSKLTRLETGLYCLSEYAPVDAATGSGDQLPRAVANGRKPAVVLKHPSGAVWMEGYLSWVVVEPLVQTVNTDSVRFKAHLKPGEDEAGGNEPGGDAAGHDEEG